MTFPTHVQSWMVAIAAPLALVAILSRRTRFLSLGPFVASDEDFIIAKTGRATQVLTLGFSSRFVLVDRAKRTIRVRTRSFWFLKGSRKIRFAQVRQILYGLSDLNPATALGLTGDSFETYSVGLRLVDGEVVRLFRFTGDGTFRRGWDVPERLEWVNGWERLTDMSGTQEGDSRDFLDGLVRILNVDIARF